MSRSCNLVIIFIFSFNLVLIFVFSFNLVPIFKKMEQYCLYIFYKSYCDIITKINIFIQYLWKYF